jgi:hypothetical protein
MNPTGKTGSMDRRGFFASLGRVSVLGALAALAAGLASRGRTNGEEPCTNQGICRGCPSFDSGCGLPQALSARAVLGRQPVDGRRA